MESRIRSKACVRLRQLYLTDPFDPVIDSEVIRETNTAGGKGWGGGLEIRPI